MRHAGLIAKSGRPRLSSSLAARHAPSPRAPALSNQAALRVLRHGGAPAPVLQRKLQIGIANDPLEHEADRIADRVVCTPASAIAVTAAPAQVSRQCASCSEEDKLQKKPAASHGGGDAPPSVHEVLRSAGEPLDAGTRADMEPRFGRDFGQVRIHRDAAAARSARAIDAKAYAAGPHLVFGADQFQPASAAGRELIAHELAHVVQQGADAPSAIRRQGDDDVQANVDSLGSVADPDVDTEEADGEDGGGTDQSQDDQSPEELGTGKKKQPSKTPAKKVNVCSAGDCPQGKQPKVVHGDCSPSGPADPSNFITNLDVDLGAGKLTVTWSNSNVETWPCTGHPGVTPKGSDIVGDKCGKSHTNLKKDGMAWFTGFAGQGLRIGFHDSQPVGPGFVSHACIRVCCDKAKIINSNSASGKTKISVK
jgi:hypothetical protein